MGRLAVILFVCALALQPLTTAAMSLSSACCCVASHTCEANRQASDRQDVGETPAVHCCAAMMTQADPCRERAPAEPDPGQPDDDEDAPYHAPGSDPHDCPCEDCECTLPCCTATKTPPAVMADSKRATLHSTERRAAPSFWARDDSAYCFGLKRPPRPEIRS